MADTPKKPRKPRAKKKAATVKTTIGPYSIERPADKTVKAKPRAEIESVTAAELVKREVRWLFDGLIPFGFPTLLTGEGQLGKSTVCGSIVAAVTRGLVIPGIDPNIKTDVVWLAAEEDPASIIRPRLQNHAADLERVHFPGWNSEGDVTKRLRLPSQSPHLREYLLSKKAGLLIIDPIGSFLDPECFEDSGGTARSIMQSLADVARATGAAIVVVKHPRKGATGSAMDQVSGSKEWVNVPRVVLSVARHPHEDDTRLVVSVKNNLVKKKHAIRIKFRPYNSGVQVMWLGQSEVSADDVITAHLDAIEKSCLDDAKALLLDRLDQGPKPCADILKAAEQAGIKLATLRRAKKELGVTSHQTGPVENRYFEWRKSDAEPPK